MVVPATIAWSSPTALAEQNRLARVPLTGERKQVTVLFADLKDSLALIHGFDPASEAQGDYRRAIDCFRQIVTSFEGSRRCVGYSIFTGLLRHLYDFPRPICHTLQR